MYCQLLLENFTINEIFFTASTSKIELNKNTFVVLRNNILFEDYDLYSNNCNGESNCYTLVPYAPFLISDRIHLEISSELHYSNTITIIFLSPVVSSKTQIEVNLPQSSGKCHFTLEKINNIDFHISTPSINVSKKLSPNESSTKINGESFSIILKNSPFLIEIELLSQEGTPITDGFYDFDFIVEKKSHDLN